MPVHYIYLIVAIAAETIGTTALQASAQFTRLWPTVMVVVSYAIVVLAGPDITAIPFHCTGDHVIDQPVFVGDACGFEFVFKLSLVDMLEQLQKPAIILFENGVLGRQIDRPAHIEPIVHRRACKVDNRFVEVVHRHDDARIGGIKHIAFDDGAVIADKFDRELAFAGKLEISGAILIAISMTTYNDGFGPAGHKSGNVFADDRLAEDYTAKNVADRPVGAAPHFLETELFHARLIRRDGCALDADTVFFDRFGAVDGDLIVGCVAGFHTKVVVFQIYVQIRQDQFLFDEIPDTPGHFVAIELDNGVVHFDLCHGYDPFECVLESDYVWFSGL